MILCRLYLILGRLPLLLLVASVLPLVHVIVPHLSAVVDEPIDQHLFLIRKTGKDRKFKFSNVLTDRGVDSTGTIQQRGVAICNET